MSKIAFGSVNDDYDLGFRDATHMPCVMVFCYDNVKAGQSIKFKTTKADEVVVCPDSERHGIVDPFLTQVVRGGSNNYGRAEKFWMLLEPKVVGSLSHSYPLILDGVQTEEEEEQSECKAMGCD